MGPPLYCLVNSVDGSEILRSPVDVGNIPLFTRFQKMPGGSLGFLPSTVGILELGSTIPFITQPTEILITAHLVSYL